MARTNASSLSALAAHLFWPTIVEARLLNDKHARDHAYVTKLANELQSIEKKIAAMERSLQLNAPGVEPHLRVCRTFSGTSSIRELSSDLERRLRRLQQAIQSRPPRTGAKS